MADALNARVYPGPQKEIGWFPIKRADNAPLPLPEEMTVFHWHGDTFELPAGAIPLASSAACSNQGFIYKHHVIGLQFHMETTLDGMEAMIRNCGRELVDAPYIQSAESIRAGAENINPMHRAMERLLDSL
jgi:GMP synthase (glutamine-hydrolysing)